MLIKPVLTFLSDSSTGPNITLYKNDDVAKYQEACELTRAEIENFLNNNLSIDIFIEDIETRKQFYRYFIDSGIDCYLLDHHFDRVL